jgi:hypothetical protein
MKPGRIVGCIAVCVGSLLVTLTSVYANHFMAGGGRYTLRSDKSETAVQFRFLGVASRLTDEFVPVIQTTIRCTIVHRGGDIPFRLFTSGTELDPFKVKRLKPQKEFPRSVTITGKMLSKIVVSAESERQHFTEIAPFEAVGVDEDIPGAGKDAFSLTIHYSADQDIGRLLLEALGHDHVTCNTKTCTLTVTGTLTDGEIEAHTAAGE